MMCVKLIKHHKQNGVLLPPGSLCMVPYELGVAMCNNGMAVRHMGHGARAQVVAEVAKRRPAPVVSIRAKATK